MDKKSRPTIKTIAQLANVSTYTVSRALGGYTDVSEATAAHIKQIASDIGYTPNAYARNLSMKKSNIIGMIVPMIGPDTAYSEVINAVSMAAASRGLCVQLGSCNRDIELEKSYCRMMCENRVEALIMVPISSEIEHIKKICNKTVPLIFFGGKVSFDEKYCITIDYTKSASIAVTHLYELGHKDIALFLYYPENKTISMKREGYKNTMNSFGLKPVIYMEGSSSDTYSAGFSITQKLICQNKLPTAIWCASDLMALGVIECLKEHNYRVPDDVSVIGHDNLFFTKVPSISLTTLTLPKEEMGIYAVNMALSIMGEPHDAVENKKAFHASLIKRKSTNIPRSQRGL